MSDYMDGTLDRKVAAVLDLHLNDCSHCRTLLEGVRALRQDLSEFPEIRVSERFVEEVLLRTTGVPKKTSLWFDFVLPAVRPFLTQRYAFATIMAFAFISFAVNIMGPGFSVSSYSRLSPRALIARAEEVTDSIYLRWREFNDLKSRAGEELKLLKEDLLGRLDYHLVTILFASYEDSLKEQSPPSTETQEPEAAPTESQARDTGTDKER